MLKKLIDDSKILERKKYLENYSEILNECVDRLIWINRYKTNELLHVFELDDEDESTKIDGFELAILRAFLYCNFIKLKKTFFFTN